MCFYHNYDWRAELVEESQLTATDEKLKCHECHRPFGQGKVYHHLLLQEYEECQDCSHEFCSCHETNECCKCEEPNYGEIFEWKCCEECHKFLKAIETVETDNGCHGEERRPALGEMMEDITNGDREEAAKYLRKAIEMFPELKASGYAGWLWRSMWVR